MSQEDHRPTEDTSRRIRATRRRDTSAEMRLRRELHGRGLRYGVDRPVVGRRRRVDLHFPGARLVVFVDGCFWHSCPLHATVPKTNTDWWRAKLAANVERDRQSDRDLEEAGYEVIRVWEHDDVLGASDRIEKAVRARTKR